MKTEDYDQWWGLHLRVARGEALKPDERAVYDAGADELDREERIECDLTHLRRLRASVAELEAENANLHKERRELDAKIAAVEARLSEETRQQLGIGIG